MVDKSFSEDLIQALQNLVSVEHHARCSYYISKDEKWLELNKIARDMRSKYLRLIYKKGNDELWCIDKHLLSSIMALQECANRLYQTKDSEISKDLENDASILLGLFLELNDIKENVPAKT